MSDQSALRQAVSDFELFLSGHKAPALIAQSLSTMVQMEIPQIVNTIFVWAERQQGVSLVDALMAARNKVFDIFFYRITRFQRIYKFFPTFERVLVDSCPESEQYNLAQLFEQQRWQDIRPIGTIQEQERFMVELRKDITVQTEKFNEDIYKNATYALLSAEKYQFDDPNVAEQVAMHQAKLKGIFTDFVDVVADKQKKREILLANESDKYSSFQQKEVFKIDNYVTQLTDLGIALFNDDFLYQSVQVFNVIKDLRFQNKINLVENKKFQEKSELFNTQKLEDYTSTRVGCLLVKQIISLFNFWQPRRMLNQLQIEESRRVRRLLLKALEAYGREIYSFLIGDLAGVGQKLPWYYARNLAYLLGRVSHDDEAVKNQAVTLLVTYWHSETHKQLLSQIISTLGFIGTDLAYEKLASRLKSYEQQYSKEEQVADICQKIVSALIAIESEKSLELAVDFSQNYGLLSQHVEKFNRIYLPNGFINSIINKIKKEVQRAKFSFSLLGDQQSAFHMLHMIGHMGNEQVQSICNEILKTISRKNNLTIEAESILQQIRPYQLFSKDRMLQKLAYIKNIAEMIYYISESRMSGQLVVRTNENIECKIDFERGEAINANVSLYYLSNEDAFSWCFLLDARDIDSIYFHTGKPQTPAEITQPTELLLSQGLVQRGQIFQITSSYLSPDSRFCRKQVSSIYTNFNQTGEPEKYQAVWDALAVNVDIATLQQMTQLSKHDVYKILLFFLKKNMLIVDGEQERQQLMSIDEGLAMIEINLKKIQRRPVMYNCYKASAEISADIARIAGDEVVKFAFGVLRRYFLEYFNGRKVLGSTNCEICLQVLVLTSAYIKSGAEKDREELLNYISFSFNIDSENIRLDASIAPQQSELMPTTTLEKIENIDLANDPLDDTIESSTLLEEMDDVLGALDRVLGSALDGGQVIESVSDGQSQFSGLTSAEEEMIRELFDNIALAYVKPLKDFIRELYRSAELQRSVSLEWYELIEPVFTLLSGSSAKMGYQQIADAVKELESSVNLQKVVAESQQSDYFPSDAVYHITVAYQKLAEMQPKTFALLASEEELAEKKEVLLVKFVLKQIPEITEKLLSKILFAGLNTFDKFMQSKPDEIAALTGMSKELAGDVYEKFYQYRNIYYDQGSLEHQRKFIALYELNLRVLREVNIDIESLVMMEKQGDEKVRVDKERLKVERQRALWALFVLLCIKEEYDFIEMIQQSVFDVRIQLLEDYFNRLTSQSQAVYQQVPLDPRLYPNG